MKRSSDVIALRIAADSGNAGAQRPLHMARALLSPAVRAALLPLVAAAALAQSPFRFEEASPKTIRLTENGKPVYAYNHEIMLPEGVPEGVPEDRARCCYLHPVWAPNGVIVTDDFPADHYHHRGVFWAWPVVKADGEQYDLWTIRGVRQRFLRWLERETKPDRAVLAVENGWFIMEDCQIARETVRITAHPAKENRRRIDFDLAFEATGSPVQLRGDPTDSKGYGGLCVRFAPREETAIFTDKGREQGDSNMVPHPWAELSALFAGGRAALRIDIDPSNPGFPNGWCLRYYGFLGVNFPGNEFHTLEPGKPLRLRYSVTVEAR